MTIAAGSAVGLLGLVVSFAGKSVVQGRTLGDPLPMVLAVGQILRNPIYVNWGGIGWHMGFVGFADDAGGTDGRLPVQSVSAAAGNIG